MKYIVHRRFKGKALCGDVNLPAMTELESEGGLITYNNSALCYEGSENSHQFFARNDDGNGMLRGRLTQSIQRRLMKHDKQHQERWDKVWCDERCQSYRRNRQTTLRMDRHETIVAERCETFRYYCIVGVLG